MNQLTLIRNLNEPLTSIDEARRLAQAEDTAARQAREARERRRRAIDRIAQVRRPPRR